MPARLFTSESVTEGHPDKICDQISDSILDALLTVDPQARVAVETLVTTGLVHVAGEVSTTGYVEIPKIVRETILEVGYDGSQKGFDGRTCGVSVSIGAQSPDIAQGVDTAHEHRTGEVGAAVAQLGEDRLDDVRPDVRLEHALERDVRGVLGREHHGVELDGPVAVVGDGDLGLAVGPQVGQVAALADRGEPLGETVGQVDRQRHVLRGVLAGIPEHEALVAGALLVQRVDGAGPALVGGVDALGDVRRLLPDRHLDATRSAVEALGGRVVPDAQHRLSDDGRDLDVGLGRHLTGDVDQTGGDHGLDGDTRPRILLEHRVEDRVADLVTDLVRVSLGDGLGREEACGHSGLLGSEAGQGRAAVAPNRGRV